MMSEFGRMGLVEFLDLNKEVSPIELPYTAQIRMVEESERSLAYLIQQCQTYNVDLTPLQNIQGFSDLIQQISDSKRKAINLLQEDIQNDIS